MKKCGGMEGRVHRVSEEVWKVCWGVGEVGIYIEGVEKCG